MRKKIIELFKTFKQFGLDPIKFVRAILNISFYLKSYFKFKKNYSGLLKFYPCLHDNNKEAGKIDNEYFWQDLIVAKWIFEASPEKHVDIGSRLDGFVAHVASFREIEVFDIRPINKKIPGMIFHQADLMSDKDNSILDKINYCDSLSCLHALEHFGLGRYGDPINPIGYRLGIENISKLIKTNGIFYLSTPIGIERVEFNANWVFDPRNIIQIAHNNKLKLVEFGIYNNKNSFQEIEISESKLKYFAEQKYNLGIFKFLKLE